ncbi:uncharacterized protein LOC128183265 [Crassostrea angulata]|uniref:uncharacterized protein LOC128183265 n=1 Tax=Magallana angulata TaxID=2784310 RepID=UPI0022B15942|nr:uncharacterized protein LOC128183265 [Crassostrea angulata]
MKRNKSLIMGKAVHSQPDVLCLTSDPSRKRPVLVTCICEVKKIEPGENTLDHPKKKIRSLNTSTSSISNIPDSKFAPHIWDLFVHMEKSVSAMAVLGVAVDKTHVRFTLLIVHKTTKEMLKTSDGRGPVHFEGLVENPRFYYKKQMNYLKREERGIVEMSALCWNDAK